MPVTTSVDEVRPLRAAAVAHGTALLVVAPLLVVASRVGDGLMAPAAAVTAAAFVAPLGALCLGAAWWAGRAPDGGRQLIRLLELVALVTAPVLGVPLLVVLEIVASAATLVATRSRTVAADAPAPTLAPHSGQRLAQSGALLHGVCLVAASFALLAAARDSHPVISLQEARYEAFVNGPLGVLLIFAAIYLIARPSAGRALLVIAEAGGFVTSLLLHVPLLIVLDMFLSAGVEMLIVMERRSTLEPELTSDPWPAVSLPWVSVIVVTTLAGAGIGVVETTYQLGAHTALLWLGGVVTAVILGVAATAIALVCSQESAPLVRPIAVVPLVGSVKPSDLRRQLHTNDPLGLEHLRRQGLIMAAVGYAVVAAGLGWIAVMTVHDRQLVDSGTTTSATVINAPSCPRCLSSHIDVGYALADGRSQTAAVVVPADATYRVGQHVMVSYDRNNPTEVVASADPALGLIVFVPLGLVVVGAALLTVGLRRDQRAHRGWRAMGYNPSRPRPLVKT